MTSPLLNLLFLVIFLTLLPSPRWQLYEEVLILFVGYIVSTMFKIAQTLKPIFNLAKIDIQSKLMSGVIVLSTVAPKAGDYVLSREFGVSQIGHAFNQSVGNDMIAFRRNLRKIYVMNVDIPEDTPKKGELLAEIKQSHSQIRQRHAIGEILIGVGVGIISIVVGSFSIFFGFGLLLSLYLLIFPLSMALRSVIVDTLAYPVEMVDVEAEEVRRPPRSATLIFMKGWNQMLLRNEKMVHKLILVSFLRGEFVLGFERGEELIKQVLSGEKELENAFDDLVTEQLGEDTTESRWIRRIIKKFISI